MCGPCCHLPWRWFLCHCFARAQIGYCFHQLFEGIGLGVVTTLCSLDTWKKFVMMAIFVLTTPVGIAVGVGIQNTYAG